MIVFGHYLLTGLSFEPGSASRIIWTILHQRGYVIADGPLQIKVTYPVLPWIGVILLGYAAGPVYSRGVSSLDRTKILIALGLACLALLGLIRGFNIYGETLGWVHGESFILSAAYAGRRLIDGMVRALRQ